MSKYTMAQIVALTGINAHTLRKWESRYTLIDPERTDSNIRYYSDKQLKKLLNVSLLAKNGFKISKIDKMSESEIHTAIANNISVENYELEINALLQATLDMDEKAFDNILKEQILKRGLLTTTLEIIYPFLHQVGVLWGLDKVMPAQEHLVSNLIKKKMLATIDLLPYPNQDAPSIVMFLIEGEYHELGLLLAYYLARELGWKVYYLGQNVPVTNIKQVVENVKPDAMLTMFINPIDKSSFNEVNNLISSSKTELCVSGTEENINKINGANQVTTLLSPTDFIDFLKKKN